MADNMNLELTSRDIIKPSSPTPEHLRTVKLSMLDQIIPDMYVPLILFYPFYPTTTSSDTIHQNPNEIATMRLQRLRETLSVVLDLYYPFAGRLRNNLIIECNDEGVQFITAKSTFALSSVLKIPDPVGLKSLLSAQPESKLESHGGYLLLVKATTFSCGGLSLGMSFYHKLTDACAIGGFLRNWAISSNQNSNQCLMKPEFGQACHTFPPFPQSLCTGSSSMELVPKKCITRRYVFTAEKIRSLKSIVKNNPTRVEVVSALLWKCAIKASASRESRWFLAMNMRKRIVPPFKDNIVGNLVAGMTVKTDHHDEEGISLQALVDKLRKGVKEAAQRYSDTEHVLKNVQELFHDVQTAIMESDEVVFYSCTTWCRFGLYETDFGWEAPKWVSVVSSEWKNSFMFMDTKDGDGIEAWLSFPEEVMECLGTDPEWLYYASFNPTVI